MGTMRHRPFRELTKDWPPERLARNEARVKEMLAELDRQEAERTRDERTSRAAAKKASSRSPALTRRPDRAIHKLWTTWAATPGTPWWLRFRPN